MELRQAIEGRRAVRAYTTAAVPHDVILDLIGAAAQAPSAMNLQPWIFAVVEGQDRLDSLSDLAKRHLLTGMTADSPLASHRARLGDSSFSIYYGAPCLIVICARPPSRQASEDCCLAAENLMLAAHARDLGTCWIGLSRPWLETPEAHALLGLPSDCAAVAPIIVGVPRSVPSPTERRKPTVLWCAP